MDRDEVTFIAHDNLSFLVLFLAHLAVFIIISLRRAFSYSFTYSLYEPHPSIHESLASIPLSYCSVSAVPHVIFIP